MTIQAELSGLMGALQNGGVVKWFDTFKRMGRSNPRRLLYLLQAASLI